VTSTATVKPSPLTGAELAASMVTFPPTAADLSEHTEQASRQ
jgi:hypothetical protein